MDLVGDSHAGVEFGRFRLSLQRRELLAEGAPVELGSRALEILVALIEAGGALVTKDEILSRVWPGVIVEENNLQVQISALRKVLGEDRDVIRTVPGRGYRFTATLRSIGAGPEVRSAPDVDAAAAPAKPGPPTNLPAPISDLIGREAELEEVLDLLAEHRLLTLTGAGGIGKTRLGLGAARRLLPNFADGVWLAELAPLSDHELVPAAVASALGLELVATQLSPERIGAALGPKRLLLVLDNCEHVIDAAARMAETLLRLSAGVRILATSREPLAAEGEWTYQLSPLGVPPGDSRDATEVLRYGAARLFVARARGADAHFSLDDGAAASVGAICRNLDGVPLALELAAARVPALGIEQLAERLKDRFRVLTGGRRTALPRHQTLKATLDWSYGLLAETDRVVLRRLSVFAGSFTLEAACAIAADERSDSSLALDCIADLVAKSLLVADVSSARTSYRLLETMRSYGLERLAESGEVAMVARRHAEYYRDLAQRAEAEWDTMPTAEWSATYAPSIDNIRAALDWAFAPGGDLSTGGALTVASVPLWVQLLQLDECRRRVERAIAGLAVAPGCGRRHEMQLQAALGLSLTYTKGPMPETGAVWTRALELAVSLDDTEYQLRSLWGLWVYRISIGEPRTALALAQRFQSLAESKGDSEAFLIGERMTGVLLHYLGDQTNARACFERMLNRYVAPVRRSLAVRFLFDQHVTALVILARVLWLQGFPDRAVGMAQTSVEEARSLNHATSLCYALADAACPIALLTGDLAMAERMVPMLLNHSANHALAIWDAWGRCLKGTILVKRGSLDTGLSLLRTALGELRETRFALRYTAFQGTLAQALGDAGRIGDGLATIDEALQRSEHCEERWCAAELLRIRGELLLLGEGPDAAAAEKSFVQSLDLARGQDALSWELRSATSLARLWREKGRTGEARELLAAVYARFTEGFATSDLNAARDLINNLR